MTMKTDEAYHSKQVDEVLSSVSSDEANRIEHRMLLAAKIHDAMKAKGFTKIAFAGRMKKKPSVITKWLSGTHNFTTDTLFDIEEVLGIDLVNVKEKPTQETMHFQFFANDVCVRQSPISLGGSMSFSNYSFLCTASGLAYRAKGSIKSEKTE
jgi:transcriptional regulator with XRE-family HTH domain